MPGSDNLFKDHEEKLKNNVYGSVKGSIRLELIRDDLDSCMPPFTEGGLKVLDIGGGAGEFAGICLGRGHNVVLCDSSPAMLEQAAFTHENHLKSGLLKCCELDFLSDHPILRETYDLVLAHGSVEWMRDTDEAIRKAVSLVNPSGLLSLLVFNRDKEILKKGIGGRLAREQKKKNKRKLTPPGSRSPVEVADLLAKQQGELLVQSGIRIFYGFFRQNDPTLLEPEEWLAQERMYYRQPPFSGLGEHTHFVWKKATAMTPGKQEKEQ